MLVAAILRVQQVALTALVPSGVIVARSTDTVDQPRSTVGTNVKLDLVNATPKYQAQVRISPLLPVQRFHRPLVQAKAP